MNNKGFTLVELLGSMVILGLLMILVVPNVVGLLNSSKETVYIEDAKKLVNIAKTKVSNKEFTVPKKENECAFLGLGYLENAEFDNPPNGGCYDVNRSYVLVRLKNSKYEYHVKLVEVAEGKYNGIIDPTNSDNLSKDSIKIGESNGGTKFDYLLNEDNGIANSIECSGGVVAKKTKNGPRKYNNESGGVCAMD